MVMSPVYGAAAGSPRMLFGRTKPGVRHAVTAAVGVALLVAALAVSHQRNGELSAALAPWVSRPAVVVPPADAAGPDGVVPWAVVSTQRRAAWCDPLMRDPRPADRVCSPREPGGCPEGVAPRFFSQFGQDAWLWSHHFRHLARPGVFVDLATNDPISISNTYFLERCLGWSGLCIEPNGNYHARILEHRSCELIPVCVANHTKVVSFIEAGGLGGIADSNKNVDGKHVWQKGVSTAPRRRITCTRLAQLLHRRAVTHVDYLSLDIEGAELEALQSIDWSAVRIDVISLEEESDDKQATKFLTDMGYKVVQYKASRPEELMLFHPSVEVGSPTP